MKHSEYNWNTVDGVKIFAQNWEPDQPCKAVVCLVHGVGEHSGRYTHLAAFLNQKGYVLAGFDLRGHGKSEGQRGHAPDFDTLLDDIKRFIALNRERYEGKPIFLYGHSLGGTLVLDYAIRHDGILAGIIATGPLIMTAFKPPAWKLSLGKIMAKIMPTFTMSNEVNPQAISRDPEVVRAYIQDPLVHNRLSAQLGIEMLNAGDWILEHATGFPLPLLLMNGSDDHLVSALACVEFAEKAGSQCTLRLWEGLYHEIHNEPEQNEVFDYLSQWLERRLTGG